MLDWTERLTLAVTAVFGVTLAVTIYVDSPLVWLLWSGAMAVLASGVLVRVNRSAPRRSGRSKND